MKEEIFQIIEELSEEIRKSKKAPILVIDMELNKAIKRRVPKCLRELYKEERIDFGRTINHNFVELRSLDSPKRNRKVILHDSLLLND